MSAGAIRAGEAFVKIWANDAEARKALKGLQTKVKAFADDVTAMGKRVAMVGVAMAAPFAAAAKVFSGFADTMSTVKAVTSATGAEFEKLNATAKHLGETTSFTAKEAAEGMLALARAGFTATENIAALPNALNLARAGALGLGEATTIMADTSRSFGIAATESERVADALAKASNIANTDVRLIGESMKHVAATARLSGQGLESMSAALSVMANRGIKGEMAGTALRKVLVELANVKKQASLKTDFGIDVKDARGNMRDVLDIMRELGAATANMGNTEKTSLFRDLFDVRGFRARWRAGGNAAVHNHPSGRVHPPHDPIFRRPGRDPLPAVPPARGRVGNEGMGRRRVGG